MFETFVEDYDAKNVFDSQLQQQTAWFWDPHGSGMNRYDVVMDTESLTAELEDLAERVRAPWPEMLLDVLSNNIKSDVLDLPMISNATR